MLLDNIKNTELKNAISLYDNKKYDASLQILEKLKQDKRLSIEENIFIHLYIAGNYAEQSSNTNNKKDKNALSVKAINEFKEAAKISPNIKLPEDLKKYQNNFDIIKEKSVAFSNTEEARKREYGESVVSASCHKEKIKMTGFWDIANTVKNELSVYVCAGISPAEKEASKTCQVMNVTSPNVKKCEEIAIKECINRFDSKGQEYINKELNKESITNKKPQ